MTPLSTHTRRQVGGAVLGVCVGILTILVITLLVRTWSLTDTIRTSQIEGTKARESTDRTLDAVQSCTTPGRDCYDRGQRQTAAAVGDINKVVVLAAACAVGLDPQQNVVERQTQIQACVIQRLAAERPRR